MHCLTLAQTSSENDITWLPAIEPFKLAIAHPGQVVDTKLTRSIEGAGCSSDLTGLYQGFDSGQLAVWRAFFHRFIFNLIS